MSYTSQLETIVINGTSIEVSPERVEEIIAQILGQARAVEAQESLAEPVAQPSKPKAKLGPTEAEKLEAKAQEIASRPGTKTTAKAVAGSVPEGSLELKRLARKLKSSTQTISGMIGKIDSPEPLSIRSGGKCFATPLAQRVIAIRLAERAKAEEKPKRKYERAEKSETNSAQEEFKGWLD